ncbi:MAG: GNAT family protein [bacterium]
MNRRIFIKGGRVTIRNLRVSDLGRVARWINDPETAYLLGIRTTVTLDSQRTWHKNMMNDPTKLVAAIVITRTGRHIGNVGIQNISEPDRNGALNVFIGDKKDRRRGYALEAVELFLRFCFTALDLERVCLLVHEENAAARKLYEAAGFRKEGLLRRHEKYGGRRVNKVVMGVLRDEYFTMKPRNARETARLKR